MKLIAAVIIACLAIGCDYVELVSLTADTAVLTGGTPLLDETNAATIVAIIAEKSSYGVAGGALLDEQGLTYAAFVTSSTEGSYTAMITFEGVNQVSPINFTGTSGKRRFIASFYDDDRNPDRAPVDLVFTCRATEGLVAACGGVCTDELDDPTNCGGCGITCVDNEACVAGECAAP